MALVAPAEIEKSELGLATREADFALGDVVEQLAIEKQVVELGFGEHIAYVT